MAGSRVIALIDMDCFYVQVEERDDPSIKGKPAAVVQYNSWKGGSIIAVNYEARAKGVSRNIRGEEANTLCPEIILVKVPESRGKADLTKYRNAGQEIIKVLTEFSTCVERASIDEAYIDLTDAVQVRLGMTLSDPENALKGMNICYLENNFILGAESLDEWLETLRSGEFESIDDVKLTIGAEIIGEMRKAIFEKTGFRCSAGIAHNKVLAKLACGINKPNKQTVVPHASVPELFKATKLKKVRNLGGKLGDDLIEKLECETMSDLLRFSAKQLCAMLGEKSGSWLFSLARGRDDEPVTPRQLAKSIGCNKMFNGPEALVTKEKAKYWIQQLSAEVVERLENDLIMNSRRAKSITLSVKFENQGHLSRTCGTNPSYNAERMATDSFATLEKLYRIYGLQPINNLGLVASKFEDELDITKCMKINKYFTRNSDACPASTPIVDVASTVMPTTTGIAIEESEPRPCSSRSIGKPKSLLQSGILFFDSEIKSQDMTSSEILRLCAENSKYDDSSQSQSSDISKSFFNRQETPTKEAPESGTNNSCEVLETLTSSELSESPVKSFMKTCDKCGQSIVMWDFASHMDYHFAKDLQREINGLPPLPSIKLNENKSPQKSQKRGANSNGTEGIKKGRLTKNTKVNSGSARTKANSKMKGMKTLESYFSQK